MDAETWTYGSVVEGEGVYSCYNRGSCIQPDVCTCPDGWEGVDCNIPICRHRNALEEVVGCLNNGICAGKDNCACQVTDSLLQIAHPDLVWQNPNFKTGWEGSDCSIPKCVQGYFDPTCEGVATGGEGCYRCLNGGNCTAPDFCTCTDEWTGFDCGTPVCEIQATNQTIIELDTVDPLKVLELEKDPCRTKVTEIWNGVEMGQGNCSYPGVYYSYLL